MFLLLLLLLFLLCKCFFSLGYMVLVDFLINIFLLEMCSKVKIDDYEKKKCFFLIRIEFLLE